jgi:hypothetical protein
MSAAVRTIEEFKDGALTLTREVRDSRFKLTLLEDERKVTSAKGRDEREAAIWFVRHINRMARQAEALVEKAGFLSWEEIDEAVMTDPDKVASERVP